MIYQHVLASVIKFFTLHIYAEHCLIQKNRGATPMFRTTVGSLVILKEELPAPRETVVKAGWWVMSSWRVVVRTSAVVTA